MLELAISIAAAEVTTAQQQVNSTCAELEHARAAVRSLSTQLHTVQSFHQQDIERIQQLTATETQRRAEEAKHKEDLITRVQLSERALAECRAAAETAQQQAATERDAAVQAATATARLQAQKDIAAAVDATRVQTEKACKRQASKECSVAVDAALLKAADELRMRIVELRVEEDQRRELYLEEAKKVAVHTRSLEAALQAARNEVATLQSQMSELGACGIESKARDSAAQKQIQKLERKLQQRDARITKLETAVRDTTKRTITTKTSGVVKPSSNPVSKEVRTSGMSDKNDVVGEKKEQLGMFDVPANQLLKYKSLQHADLALLAQQLVVLIQTVQREPAEGVSSEAPEASRAYSPTAAAEESTAHVAAAAAAVAAVQTADASVTADTSLSSSPSLPSAFNVSDEEDIAAIARFRHPSDLAVRVQRGQRIQDAGVILIGVLRFLQDYFVLCQSKPSEADYVMSIMELCQSSKDRSPEQPARGDVPETAFEKGLKRHVSYILSRCKHEIGMFHAVLRICLDTFQTLDREHVSSSNLQSLITDLRELLHTMRVDGPQYYFLHKSIAMFKTPALFKEFCIAYDTTFKHVVEVGTTIDQQAAKPSASTTNEQKAVESTLSPSDA
jgi:hypothetical protein